MYAILRFASLFSTQQFVTMTVFLRSIAYASKSRTIETTVETSSQNALSAQLVQKQTMTQFDSKDLAKKNCEICLFRTKHLSDIILTEISSEKKKKREKRRKKNLKL
jgi:hypothetical protein